jgi:hypothetical protein
MLKVKCLDQPQEKPNIQFITPCAVQGVKNEIVGFSFISDNHLMLYRHSLLALHETFKGDIKPIIATFSWRLKLNGMLIKIESYFLFNMEQPVTLRKNLNAKSK